MTVKPILFSVEMVRAILAGKKTMTRRVITPEPTLVPAITGPGTYASMIWKGTKWRPPESAWGPFTAGGRLWVRETWGECAGTPFYRADEPIQIRPYRWKPAMFMPRKYARIYLEIVRVRVERVQDIGEWDALAEGLGMDHTIDPVTKPATKWFRELWDELNAARGFGWDRNPAVWVVSFRRCNDV